jgi:branched-chain amino acid transport system permease protein
MDTLAQFVVSGIVLGAIYAVAASGLVVTYTTSGIFNFAHGAFGMFGAYFYWQMVVDWGWPKVPALIVLLGIVAPLFGAVIERTIMRGLQGVSAVTRLVVSISLLVGMLQLAQVIWTSEVGRTGPEFFEGERFTIVGYGVSYHEAVTIIVALLIALGLRLLLYRTRLGIAMRSVVDDRSLASLNGARPDLTAMASWALGAMLAAVAGVLVAGAVSLDHLALTLLVINAYAAAIFGRLRSLPLTFVGALVLGLIDSFILVYSGDVLDAFGWQADWFATSFRAVVPVLVLFVVLMVIRPSHLRTLGSSQTREIVPKPTLMKIVRWGGVMILVAIALGLWLESVDALWGTQDLDDLIRGVGISIIMLSLVPLTGYGGQISLAQMTFAGIGGVSMAYWGDGNQALALLAGVGLAAVVGALVSLPALRLRGIYLALATMAFAVFMESFVFRELPLLASGSARVEPLSIPFFSLDSDTSTLVFLSVVFVLMSLFVVYLQRSPFGRRLQAMKDSEAASATIGISLVTTKLAVFSLSAGMAGFGGALYFSSIETVGTTDVAMINSLIVMLMAVVGGISSVGGVLFGGMALGVFDIISTHIPALTNFFKVAPGLVGISLGRNPNGAVNEIARNLRERGDVDTTGDGEDDVDLTTLGVERPFTEADIEVLDRTLDLAEEADRAVTVTSVGTAS